MTARGRKPGVPVDGLKVFMDKSTSTADYDVEAIARRLLSRPDVLCEIWRLMAYLDRAELEARIREMQAQLTDVDARLTALRNGTYGRDYVATGRNAQLKGGQG